MTLTLQRAETCWLLRIEGQITLPSAGELKQSLLEWLAARKDLELDLQAVEEIDITALQLLSSAACEAARMGLKFGVRTSDVTAAAARDAGFARIRGFPIQD
jgi:anti-anti-sigma regulatory factor